jgi:hypothetical protein
MVHNVMYVTLEVAVFVIILPNNVIQMHFSVHFFLDD